MAHELAVIGGAVELRKSEETNNAAVSSRHCGLVHVLQKLSEKNDPWHCTGCDCDVFE